MGNNKSQLERLGREFEKQAISRDERCVPIAEFIIQSFVDNKIGLKERDLQETLRAYKPIYEDVIKLGLEKGWMVNDIIYSIKLIARMVEALNALIPASLSENQDQALKMVLGKDIKKLSVLDLDNLLKKPNEKLV